MKTATHIGNAVLILKRSVGHHESSVLMGLKRPKDKRDDKRKRRRIGIGLWVPPGGGTEKNDISQKHGAQREVYQETGLKFPLRAFRKAGILKGYLDSTGVPTWLVHLYVIDFGNLDRPIVHNEEYIEMRWFPLSKLPFGKMLQGDREWLPRIVRGEKLFIKLRENGGSEKDFSITIVSIKSFN